MRRLLLCLLLGACKAASGEAADLGPPATERPATEPSEQTPTADAAPEASRDASLLHGCTVQRVPKASACAEDCDARLLLPKGDTYCTIACEAASACAPAGLLCPSTIGACVPSCVSDAECKAAGFRRCDEDAGACDTE